MSYFFELLVYQKWVADVENAPSAAQNFKIYIIACVRSLLKNIGNIYLLFPSFYHSLFSYLRHLIFASVRLPKNYNPDVDPDPERWLPRWERSTFKHRKQKRGQICRCFNLIWVSRLYYIF